MNIQMVCVGKLKEKYLVQGIAEYSKRLAPYVRLSVHEVPDEKAPENMSEAEMRQVQEKEGVGILSHIKPDTHVIALAIGGQLWSSEDLAAHMDKLGTYGTSNVALSSAALTASPRTS